jgi:hypothetical protein
MVDHPKHLGEIERDWQHLAIYYSLAASGRGVVRPRCAGALTVQSY